jgi:hypothetical protein
MELSNRVYDYIDSEEAEDYDDDYEEAYKNLSTGGAIEYDLIEEIVDEISSKFSIDRNTIIDGKRNVDDIAHDHLMSTCTWKDSSVFNRMSTEPYKSMFDRMFGTNWDSDLGEDIKL